MLFCRWAFGWPCVRLFLFFLSLFLMNSNGATRRRQGYSRYLFWSILSRPLWRALIDRVGPRKVVLPGIIVLCIGLCLSGSVTSLTQLYITYGLVAGFGAAFISIIAYSAVLSRWFERRRGLASGIAVSGMGVGTFTLVPFVQYLIGIAGWRFAYLAMAGLVFLLLFPLTAAFLRYRPEEMGLQADPVRRAGAPRKRAVEVVDRAWAETDWTLRRAVREGRIWAVLAYCFLVIIPLYVVLTHAVGLLAGAGFDKWVRPLSLAFWAFHQPYSRYSGAGFRTGSGERLPLPWVP